MQPRLDILPPPQRTLWPELAAVPRRFILYGGTAIALRLGHRDSIDFDFFAADPLAMEDLMAALPWLEGAAVLRQDSRAFTCLVERSGQPVKLSFFAGLRCGRVRVPDRTADGVLRIASAADLLGHKLKVILQRAEGKDYQDIAALLAAGGSLAKGLGAAATLFPGFPVMEAARALSYREDIGEPWRLDAEAAAGLDRALQELPEAIPPLPLQADDLAAA
jgi:hypothetical protein